MKGPQKRYTVLRTFVAGYAERIWSGVKGDELMLPVEVAEWLNRDRPGRLREVQDKPKPRKKRAARAVRTGQDRMVREGEDR